jgi:Ni/Fe-hydrogenase subunit HybB-like protein
LRALEIDIGDDSFRDQMFRFLEKLFLEFCWGAFVSNAVIIAANVVLMPFGKQFEPVDRLIRASTIALVMFICLKKKYDNIYTLNNFVYFLYFTVEILIFDTCLKVTPFSRLMAMAVVIQYQNLLHKFSLFNRRQKIMITIFS